MDKTAMTPIQSAPTGWVCPDCGSELRSYRVEFGASGQWNYSWMEGLRCTGCKRINVPPGTPNDPGEPLARENQKL